MNTQPNISIPPPGLLVGCYQPVASYRPRRTAPPRHFFPGPLHSPIFPPFGNHFLPGGRNPAVLQDIPFFAGQSRPQQFLPVQPVPFYTRIPLMMHTAPGMFPRYRPMNPLYFSQRTPYHATTGFLPRAWGAFPPSRGPTDRFQPAPLQVPQTAPPGLAPPVDSEDILSMHPGLKLNGGEPVTGSSLPVERVGTSEPYSPSRHEHLSQLTIVELSPSTPDSNSTAEDCEPSNPTKTPSREHPSPITVIDLTVTPQPVQRTILALKPSALDTNLASDPCEADDPVSHRDYCRSTHETVSCRSSTPAKSTGKRNDDISCSEVSELESCYPVRTTSRPDSGDSGISQTAETTPSPRMQKPSWVPLPKIVNPLRPAPILKLSPVPRGSNSAVPPDNPDPGDSGVLVYDLTAAPGESPVPAWVALHKSKRFGIGSLPTPKLEGMVVRVMHEGGRTFAVAAGRPDSGDSGIADMVMSDDSGSTDWKSDARVDLGTMSDHKEGTSKWVVPKQPDDMFCPGVTEPGISPPRAAKDRKSGDPDIPAPSNQVDPSDIPLPEGIEQQAELHVDVGATPLPVSLEEGPEVNLDSIPLPPSPMATIHRKANIGPWVACDPTTLGPSLGSSSSPTKSNTRGDLYRPLSFNNVSSPCQAKQSAAATDGGPIPKDASFGKSRISFTAARLAAWGLRPDKRSQDVAPVSLHLAKRRRLMSTGATEIIDEGTKDENDDSASDLNGTSQSVEPSRKLQQGQPGSPRVGPDIGRVTGTGPLHPNISSPKSPAPGQAQSGTVVPDTNGVRWNGRPRQAVSSQQKSPGASGGQVSGSVEPDTSGTNSPVDSSHRSPNGRLKDPLPSIIPRVQVKEEPVELISDEKPISLASFRELEALGRKMSKKKKKKSKSTSSGRKRKRQTSEHQGLSKEYKVKAPKMTLKSKKRQRKDQNQRTISTAPSIAELKAEQARLDSQLAKIEMETEAFAELSEILGYSGTGSLPVCLKEFEKKLMDAEEILQDHSENLERRLSLWSVYIKLLKRLPFSRRRTIEALEQEKGALERKREILRELATKKSISKRNIYRPADLVKTAEHLKHQVSGLQTGLQSQEGPGSQVQNHVADALTKKLKTHMLSRGMCSFWVAAAEQLCSADFNRLLQWTGE